MVAAAEAAAGSMTNQGVCSILVNVGWMEPASIEQATLATNWQEEDDRVLLKNSKKKICGVGCGA